MPAASRRVEFAPGEVPVLLGYAALAIYGCVPETDQMRTIGWLVVGLLVVELVTRTPSALLVQFTAAGIVLWSGLYGATGRGSAIVGASFAFWPIVLVLAWTLALGPRPSGTRWMIGAIGGVASIGVARTGGIEPATAPALVAVSIAAPLSILASWVAVWFSDRSDAPATRR